jgi:hypothetical protein
MSWRTIAASKVPNHWDKACDSVIQVMLVGEVWTRHTLNDNGIFSESFEAEHDLDHTTKVLDREKMPAHNLFNSTFPGAAYKLTILGIWRIKGHALMAL